MKIKYAIVFIFIMALVIIEKESNIISRVSEKMMLRQTPQQTTQTSLDYSNTTQPSQTISTTQGSPSNRTEEQHEKELQNGRRKHILLMATTRSGSSFVGQFFNQHGENMFYLFEPLWHVERMMMNKSAETNNSSLLPTIYRDVLKGLFLCDFSPLEKFISPPPQNHVTSELFRRHSSSSLCEEQVCTPVIKDVYERYGCKNRLCGPLNLTLASQLCLSKKHQAIKTVRVQKWQTLQPLLEDPRLDMKIIQLVRDPRAILASRILAFPKYQTWNDFVHDGHPPENYKEVLQGNCDNIRWAAEVGLSQPDWLRRRYMLVRYEDIARFPMQKAEEMYRFTGIPFSPQVREWILRNTHTTQGKDDLFSTQRNSSEQAEKWRYNLPFTLAQLVQRLCGPTMKLFGYKFVNNAKMLVNKSISLCEDRTFQ
ncbi:carbohydrate sulfotransferase 3a [Corythoichthys intestinalis]|uniref:carbohydrate sulfotransferase 3a n=1 Tax=Corythoichthys intestinalis TaxID=161448 RepID=UPI0025A571E4|nr:carbohydrate sulfotransferase 3a [Corythoichthys intestinalis]XP_057704985.1 carbohydrate sulfotransferase 3a [Corythoichthys intestinalis]XP_061794385.1 carbohydrate sulfotransferase 3-like [Nerophis lumbriciformis]